MEPIAALVAVTMVGVALSLYAGALADVTPTPDRDRAALLFEEVHDDVAAGGIADPDRLAVPDAAPPDVGVGVALVTRDHRWTAGPVDTSRPYPETADVATGAVSVRVRPGVIRAGELRVVIRS